MSDAFEPRSAHRGRFRPFASFLIALRFLPLSALPQVDFPTIQVRAAYPGASPEVISQTLTAPLERQFGQMPGLNQMSSNSSGGASVITDGRVDPAGYKAFVLAEMAKWAPVIKAGGIYAD